MRSVVIVCLCRSIVITPNQKQPHPMINKRPLIAKKPTADVTPSADNWVTGGGIDPEIQSTSPVVINEPQPQGKPYPHRISFDTTADQYKRLKRASFDSRLSMNEILRSAADAWLESNERVTSD
jgi:hypothetical protein